MKNLLIVALAAGLGASLYFNFNPKATNLIDAQSLKLGSTMRISFFKKDANNNNVLITSLETSQSSKDATGSASFKSLCCPIPPRDTMAVSTTGQINCIDIAGLTEVEIKPAETTK
jgi:hypothetical protein